MNLVIVESPTKAKTIGRFLGNSFTVRSSFGHVRDLPKSTLGIDVEHNFTPRYKIIPKAREVVKELKDLAKKSDTIILATDEDREGEAIAWHLLAALDLEEKGDKKKIERIVFHEITKSAIQKALEHPREIDNNLVDAQQARRVLDRLVGYELSPFLWKKIRYGLSAGRVQSVAVRLVVEREREIKAFVAQKYWSIEADFAEKDSEELFHGKLIKVADKTLGKLDIDSDAKAQSFISDLKNASYNISEVQQKEVARNPAAPFTTSTLQQEASRKFGMSAKQTMVIAQQLYEGIDIGQDHPIGLITYMRTDSLNLSESALAQAQEVITKHFGKEYGLTTPRHYKTKSKGAQEAHEAIRPTDLALHPDTLKNYLDKGQYRLYDIIWKRTLASQMQAASFDQTAVIIDAITSENKKYIFRASGQVMLFDGFIKVYTEGSDENEEDGDTQRLPDIKQGDDLSLKKLESNEHTTEPPARYSDATLVKTLEAHGVGRPSTYAPTLSTIQDRGYVEKIEKRYQPTETGFLVNDMLVENFPKIVDIDFTSHVEEQLDDIAEGKIKWVPVIEEFYGPFKQNLVEKEASVEKLTQESDTPCPHCSKKMLIKFGRMGKFLACPDKDSNITMPLPEEAALIKRLEEQTKGEQCPLCSKNMAIKRGRFGYFLGCVDYPACKGISKIITKIGFKCPSCSTGDLIEKKARGRGNTFYGCSRYPECTFIINKKPGTQEELQELFEQWKVKPHKPPKKPRDKTAG